MPRGTITPVSEVESLSILAEDGTVDEDLEPELDGNQLQRLHRTMLLARRFDERMLNLHRQGKLGTFAPVSGQEAAQLGAVAVLRDSDWMVPSYRESAAAIWRGTPLEGLLLYNAGFNEGGAIPEAQNDLPIAIPVGTQMLHAVGIAYGLRQREQPGIAMTFFGDGATSQGDFHEAMNFASVFDTPVVFVCENNQWAISVPRTRQTRSKTLAQKALAYDMPGIQVDGNDLLAVYSAAKTAAERARHESRPTLIECVTYRLSVHTTVDDPSKYRDEAEVETWRKRDPLPRLQGYMKGRDLLDDSRIRRLEAEVEEQIDEAWRRTEKLMAEHDDPLAMFEHVYAEMPPALARQRDRLAAELQEREASAEAEAEEATDEETEDGEEAEEDEAADD